MSDGQISNSGEPASNKAHPKPPSRILVVEDDQAMRHFSVTLLIRSGYEVSAAIDGADGWEALQATGYDLLITDNHMPRVSGVELVRKLRFARMALPVILISGVMPFEELDRHPQLQLAATLQKPFTSAELLGTVEKVLRPINSTCGQEEPPSTNQAGRKLIVHDGGSLDSQIEIQLTINCPDPEPSQVFETRARGNPQ